MPVWQRRVYNGNGVTHACRDTNLLVWGVDLVEEHLMACAGIPVRPPIAKSPLLNMAEYTINAAKSGHIKHFDFLQKYQVRDRDDCRPGESRTKLLNKEMCSSLS